MAQTPLTVDALKSLAGQETDEVWVTMVEISGDEVAVPLRFAYSTIDIVSNGDTYIASEFQIGLLQQSDTELPRVTIRIPNVDLQIMEELRRFTISPDVSLFIVLESDPDTPQYGPVPLLFQDVVYDEIAIEGNLVTSNLLAEPASSYAMTPTYFPGLF